MSGEPPLLGYSQIIGELRRLCADRRTGTMFMVTAANQSGQFGVREGNIVAIRFQLKRGIEAINEIRKIPSARYNFTDYVAEATDPQTPLPPTRHLLRLLMGDERDVAPPLSEEDLTRAENVLVPALAEFLGPMASVIVHECILEASHGGQDLRQAIEAIAKEIKDPVKAGVFKQQVLPKLGRSVA